MAANPFVLTAQLRVTGPVGLNQVVSRIQSQVQSALAVGAAGVRGTSSGGATKATPTTIVAAASATQRLSKQTVAASKATQALNSGLLQSSRRFSTIVRDIATLTGGMLTLHGALLAIIGGFKSLVTYESQLGAMAQITRTNVGITAALGKEMRALSKQYGISAELLGKNAIELLQAGRSLQQVKEALPTLALLGTNAQVGAEGLAEASKAMIVWQNTFKQTQAQTAQSFEKVVALAKRQFISVSELIEGTTILSATAKSSGASFEEMISIIASTKSQAGRPVTEVARALNTLLSRVVSEQNVKKLKDLGVEVFDDSGIFRGIFNVARDLRAVRDAAGEASEKAIQLDILLGGIRRRSLAGAFLDSLEEAEANLRAISGNIQELEKDWQRVARTMGVQLGTTLEYVRDAFLEITETQGFKDLVELVLALVKGFAQLAVIVKDLVPALLTISALKLSSVLGGAAIGGILGRGAAGGAGNAVVAAAAASVSKYTPGPGGTSPFGSIQDRSGYFRQPASTDPQAGFAGISQRNALPNRLPFALPRPSLSGRQALGLGLVTGAAASLVPTQGDQASVATRGLHAALTGATTGLFAFAIGLNPIVALFGGAAIALKQFIDTTNKAKAQRSIDIAQEGIERLAKSLDKNDARAFGNELSDITRESKIEAERLANQGLSPAGAIAGITQFSGIGLATKAIGKAVGLDTSALAVSERDAEGAALGFSALLRSGLSLGRESPIEAARQIQLEDRKRLGASQQALVPQVLQNVQRILDNNPNITNFEQFKQAEGGQEVADFINAMVSGARETKEAVTDLIVAVKKSRDAMQEFSDVTSRLAQSQFIDALIARRNRASLDAARSTLREREDQRTGNVRSRLSSDARLGTDDFARAVQGAPLTTGSRNVLNQAQRDFINLSEALKALDGDINNMMSTNPEEGFNAILSDPSISDGVRDALKEMLLSIPGADAKPGTEEFFKRQDAIAIAFANIFKVSEDLVKTANPEAFNVLAEALGVLNDQVDDITATFSHASNTLQSFIDATARARTSQLDVLERRSEFTRGRPLGGGFGNRIAIEQAQRLTGGTANVQFIGQRLRDLDTQREAVRQNAGLTEEERARQLGALDTATNQLIGALNALADSSSRLRGYQDDLARAQSGLAAKMGVAEEFIGGGQEGRVQMIRDAAAAQAVVQRGTFQGVSDEIAQAALRHLNRFGGIEGAGGLGGLQGFTGEEIKQALIEATIGGGFFAPERGAERTAQDNILRIMQDAANAEWELARYQEQVFNRFADRLDDVFDRIAGTSPGGDRFPLPQANIPQPIGPQPGAQQPGVGPGARLPDFNIPGGGMAGMGVGAGGVGVMPGGLPASSVIGGGPTAFNRRGEPIIPLDEQRARRRAAYEAQRSARNLQHQYRRATAEGHSRNQTQQVIDQNFSVTHGRELQLQQYNRMRSQGFTQEQAFSASAAQRLQNAQAFAAQNPNDNRADMRNVWDEILQSFREIFDNENVFGAPGQILGPLQERFFGTQPQLPQQPGMVPGQAQVQPPAGPDPAQQALADSLNNFNNNLAQNVQGISESAERINNASQSMNDAADKLAQALQERLTIDQNLSMDVNVNGADKFNEAFDPIIRDIAQQVATKTLNDFAAKTGLPIA